MLAAVAAPPSGRSFEARAERSVRSLELLEEAPLARALSLAAWKHIERAYRDALPDDLRDTKGLPELPAPVLKAMGGMPSAASAPVPPERRSVKTVQSRVVPRAVGGTTLATLASFPGQAGRAGRERCSGSAKSGGPRTRPTGGLPAG